jgi:NPCBM/NEW2 domain
MAFAFATVVVLALLAPVGLYAVIQLASRAPAASDEPEAQAEDGAPAEPVAPALKTNPALKPTPRLTPKTGRRPARGAADPPPVVEVVQLPQPDRIEPPPEPVALADGELYLRELKPVEMRILTSHGMDFDRDFEVAGESYTNGLTTAVRLSKMSHVVYDLPEPYARLHGAVAVADNKIHQSKSPIVFQILLDGNEAWRSQPLQWSGQWEAFDVDLSGAEEMRLVIVAGGSVDGAHAVWLDPKLVRATAE